jgi:hypothetical protein
MAQFTAPGALAADAFMATLLQQKALERQAMLDEMQKARDAQAAKVADAQVETARVNAAAMDDQRRAAAELNRLKAAEVGQEIVASRRQIGDVLTPEDVALAPALAEDQMTLPAKVGVPAVAPPVAQAGAPEGGVVAPSAPSPAMTPFTMQALRQDPTGQQVMRGTTQQRQIEDMLAGDALTDVQKQYLRLQQGTGGGSMPSQVFETPDETNPIVFVDEATKKSEILQNGQLVPVTGEVPKGAIVIRKSPESVARFAPYQFLTTGAGIVVGDKTAGTIGPVVAPLRPGASSEQRLADMNMVKTDLETVERTYTPDKVGPFAGRLRNLGSMWVNDPEYADFKTTVVRVLNNTIRAMTGAQMSAAEAERLRDQVIRNEQPPENFLAVLANMKKYADDFTREVAKGAYGRTPEEIAELTGRTPPPAAANPGGPAPAPRSAKELIDSVLGGK